MTDDNNTGWLFVIILAMLITGYLAHLSASAADDRLIERMDELHKYQNERIEKLEKLIPK